MLMLPEYSLSSNGVHHCDALTLLGRLPSDYVDLVVTSPPYDKLRVYKGYSWDFENTARQTYRTLKPGGVLVWVVGDSTVNGSETLTSMRQALYFVDKAGFKMHDTMIWRKVIPGVMGKRYNAAFEYMFVLSKGEPKTFNPLMKRNKRAGSVSGGGVRTVNGFKRNSAPETHEFGLLENVWDMAAGNNGDDRTGHPAVFPEELAERHILTWSNPGDLVMDFFVGSGTTGKMALSHGRKFIGCDISADYVKLARERIAQPLPQPLPFFEAS